MKRFAIALLLGTFAVLTVGPRAAAAQSLFFDYVGFDYESPDPDPSIFGEVTSGYNGVGEVPGLFAPLVADTVLNEYTYYITGLISTSRNVVGPYIIVNYTAGTLSVYEDAKSGGTHFNYGTNPPDPPRSPDTFVDGTPFVTGALTNFQIVFNTSNGSGSYEGDFEVTGGKEVSNGDIPLNQRKGWTFAGGTGNSLQIPEGYDHQIDGQVFLNEPVPARHSTLGAIKALYR